MIRRTTTSKTKQNGKQLSEDNLTNLQLVASHLADRLSFARKMGFQYGDKRKVYEALGYPTNRQLTWEYYFNKYQRQDIASAIIDRPVDATWKGNLTVIEQDTKPEDSKLSKAWLELDERLKVKQRLNRVDKLSGIGQYGILLFGFNDVKKREDWETTAISPKLKLVFLKQVNQDDAIIKTWETNTGNKRFGLPRTYTIIVRTSDTEETGKVTEITVHHSRVLHVMEGSLTSEVFGRPRLMPVVNRLEDLEKLLGGDAEMFWRGARPGYTAIPQKGFAMGDKERTQLETELDNYEHDLRRFITAEGVDIEALKQQVANPLEHIDIQLQAISAQTGIPKRILVGSERGELSSTQDKDQWLSLIKGRMEEFAEPEILRPFVDKCMMHGILPKVKGYNVLWEDVFASSEKDKVEVGAKRAESLKKYSESIMAGEILPPALVSKYLMGFT